MFSRYKEGTQRQVVVEAERVEFTQAGAYEAERRLRHGVFRGL